MRDDTDGRHWGIPVFKAWEMKCNLLLQKEK